jgi:septum formation protein
MAGPPRLILASASPRRRALLAQAGIAFEVRPAEEAEGPPLNGESPIAYARRSAEAKACAVSRLEPQGLVLGADTVVALGDLALGKPHDGQEARGMLQALSGRAHEVHTGVCLARGGQALASEVVTTEVVFRALTADEIEGYVATGEPLDKAGAYGIQGRGALLVDRIEGCYFNVVGLPLSRLQELLAAVGHPANLRNGAGKC